MHDDDDDDADKKRSFFGAHPHSLVAAFSGCILSTEWMMVQFACIIPDKVWMVVRRLVWPNYDRMTPMRFGFVNKHPSPLLPWPIELFKNHIRQKKI